MNNAKSTIQSGPWVGRLTYAVVYTDNGPGGACGQDLITTSAHTRVYLFDTEDEMRKWLEYNHDKMPKRKNSRVTACYPKGDFTNYAYNNCLEWPNQFNPLDHEQTK